MSNFEGSVDSYGARYSGMFDLDDEDGASLEKDQLVMTVTVARVKEVTLRDTPSGDTRLVFVMRPDNIRFVTERTTQNLLLQRLGFPEPELLQRELTGVTTMLSQGDPDGDVEYGRARHNAWTNGAELPGEDVNLKPSTRHEDEEPAPKDVDDVFVPSAGQPVSMVGAAHVSGGSQIEHDNALRNFVEEGWR